MRLLRRPVGVFFRDVYQLYRDVHPRVHRRQVLSDWLWRMTTPLLKRVASVRYAPTPLWPQSSVSRRGHASAGHRPHVADLVSAIRRGATVAQQSLDRAGHLVGRDEAGSRATTKRQVAGRGEVGRSGDGIEPARLGTSHAGNRQALPGLLSPAVCVLPLPIDATPGWKAAVRLPDLMGYGKPIVTTARPSRGPHRGKSGGMSRRTARTTGPGDTGD